MPGVILAPPQPTKEVKKLVLCFDGTGNEFQGNTSDTNIVKIYDKLDREDDNQFHYYQPGIGTYDISGGSLNKSALGKIQSSISKTLDSGLATTFDAHVIAGYKFLMRYYDSGDKIYMFGFSRGAFTARFLARMINTIGLLSKGNDEMVPFAYELYQNYEQAIYKEPAEHEEAIAKMNAFTRTFCRRDKHTTGAYAGVKIYFLGIFDCVSSVKTLETPFGRTRKPVSVKGTAEHVRHAVAVDEFRVKFKAALLNQDATHEDYAKDEDIKEVWFPGNHGDVGGGWPARSQAQIAAAKNMGWWGRLKAYVRSQMDPNSTRDVNKDPYQMSDVPLSWMIRELEIIGEKEKQYALKWNEQLDVFKTNFAIKHDQALQASRHNTMRLGRGAGFFKVLFWNFMDFLPLFPRWELEHGQWVMRTFPANMASARDMPPSALLHSSLLWRLRNNNSYKPRNNHGVGDRCLPKLPSDNKTDFGKYLLCDNGAAHKHEGVDHSIFALDQETVVDYKIKNAKLAAPVTCAENVEVTRSKATASGVEHGVKTSGVKPVNAVKVGVAEIFA